MTLTATDEVWLRVYDADNVTLKMGTLKPGVDADVSVLHDERGAFVLRDNLRDGIAMASAVVPTILAVGLIGLLLSNLMRLQIGFPGVFEWINAERYYQFVTMHGMIMVIYLLTALFLGGFGNYLIPLMVGARDMVFPFLNMLSFWVYLLSVLVLLDYIQHCACLPSCKSA